MTQNELRVLKTANRLKYLESASFMLKEEVYT